MGNKKDSNKLSFCETNNTNTKNQNIDSDNILTKEFIWSEAIQRLSDKDFWEIFKEYFSIRSLEAFGSHCYDILDAYIKAHEGKINRVIQKALQTKSPTELQNIRGEIETDLRFNEKIRFSLRKQERAMQGMLKGINGLLKEMGEKPKSTFYAPKPEKIIENAYCPHCEEINKNFRYGSYCQHCRELIPNPWKENTECPECKRIINRSEIFEDKDAYQLDTNNNLITCPNSDCENRFDWKKYRRTPETQGIKHCIACDQPYIPDKRNWRKQRVCSTCKAKGVDPFYLDHPDYQRRRKK
jgi:hypothetical protein